MMWNGKTIDTVGALFDAVNACQTREEAEQFMAAYRADSENADANVGYVIGYADEDTRRRLYDLFQVGHPVFGRPV